MSAAPSEPPRPPRLRRPDPSSAAATPTPAALRPRHRRLAHRRVRRSSPGSSPYEVLNKLIWDNAFVTGHAWMFPVICLPSSLLVGLLVKYAKAPSNLDGLDPRQPDRRRPRLQVEGPPRHRRPARSPRSSPAPCSAPRARSATSPARSRRCTATSSGSRPTGGPSSSSPVSPPATTASSRTRSSPPSSARRSPRPRSRGSRRSRPASSAAASGYAVFLLLHDAGFVRLPAPAAGAELPPVDAVLMVPLALVGLVLALLDRRLHEASPPRSSAASRSAWSCGRSSPA